MIFDLKLHFSTLNNRFSKIEKETHVLSCGNTTAAEGSDLTITSIIYIHAFVNLHVLGDLMSSLRA